MVAQAILKRKFTNNSPSKRSSPGTNRRTLNSGEGEVHKGSFTLKVQKKEGLGFGEVVPFPDLDGGRKRSRHIKDVMLPPVFTNKSIEERFSDRLETLSGLQRVMQHRPVVKEAL